MIVYLDDKRLDYLDLPSKFQHAIGGFSLLILGIDKLRQGSEIPIALLEVSIAGVVVFAFLAELVALRRRHSQPAVEHHHAAFGWFDLAAGGLLIFEAFHGVHRKPGYLRPPFYAGLVTLGLGLFHTRFHHFRTKRRYLKMDDAGVECRTAPFRKFKVAWTDLASVHLTSDLATFQRANGRKHTIKLGALHNREEVRAVIETHARVAGVLSA